MNGTLITLSSSQNSFTIPSFSCLDSVPCPADYEEGPNGHCYWFAVTTYGYMWYWGRQDCSEEPDSDLVIINDEEELDFLRNRTAELAEDRDWWIGECQFNLI